jgi:hypothetical protein
VGIPVNLCRSTQPLPSVWDVSACDGCGLARSRLQRLQCERKGPKTIAAKAEPVRMDWLAEFPCLYRGEKHDEEACGCAGADSVPVYQCLESQETLCVILKSNRGRLVRKDHERFADLRACEDCPLASTAAVPGQPALVPSE